MRYINLFNVSKLGQLPMILLTAENCLHKHQLVHFEVHQNKTESKSGNVQITGFGIDKREK